MAERRITARAVALRSGLLVFGLLLSLVAAEALLQAGALAIRWMGPPPTPLGSDPRIVFFGDSNTYGVYVEKSQAFPSTFETEWNRHKDLPSVQAINLGFPGTNSSRLRGIVAPVLREIEPTAVVIMVGVNDFWTVEAQNDLKVSQDAPETWAQTLWRRSRVFRFLYMLRQSIVAREIEVDWQLDVAPPNPETGISSEGRGLARVGDLDIELGWNRLPEDVPGNQEFAEPLKENLAEIVAEIGRFGAEPILATYPSNRPLYALANRVIREAADSIGCRLIDLGLVFRQLCPDKECRLMYPDGHPTVAGHAEIGRILARKLREIELDAHRK
jgi:lysophospholipase L1-like esterase